VSAYSRRFLAVLSGVALASATAVSGLASTAAAVGGVLTPAIASNPHYQVAGKVSAEAQATTFSCQTTTPAGCYGPAQIRAA
jgi:hypothetical protein